jgi:hypothetical protein
VTKNQNSQRTRPRIRVLSPLACALAILLGASACGAAASAGAASRSTPAGTLTQWLQLVARGDYHAACEDMVPPPGTIKLPVTLPPNPCTSQSSPVLQGLESYHANFVADGIKASPQISVSAPHANGASVTIPGTDIHISGATLTSLVAAHSTGLSQGQLSVSFTLDLARGVWYVIGTNLNVG